MQRSVHARLLTVGFLFLAAVHLAAQGTAISYQGRLSVAGSPANTNYDLRFAVFNAPTNGAAVSGWLTNAAVPVSNGLFSVVLDFGPGIFDGAANGSNDWLELGVRAPGATNFTSLAPRQPILPAPYAIFATSASNLLGSVLATQITGTLSSALLSGTYSNGVRFVNGANSFSGNGSNLTTLNASQISYGTLADARLAPDVALLGQNQTFSGVNVFTASNSFAGPGSFAGANSFSGVNKFTNNGNSFFGSFFGNGLVGWFPVYGATTNAMRDAGYLLLNAGLTTLTLPATASLTVGDIVRIAGGGAGGWLVKENAGQSVVGNFAAYPNATLTPLASSPTSDGHGVAASADGVRMYAVGADISGVYASADSGRTWGQVSGTQLSGFWSSVACSANGRIVYAQQSTTGTIEKSTDGGATWSVYGTGNGNAIACTADGATPIYGSYSYACSGNGTYRARLSGGVIAISANGGTSFPIAVPAPASGVTCLGASSDCTRLVAGVGGGLLYATSNQGATWTQLTTTNQAWSGAWMSPDGSKFAAAVSHSGSVYGTVFTGSVSALPNTASTTSSGGIGGSLGAAVELQYLGGGQFMPVGSTGLLWAN